jgi:transglutaminase-like putative cysteine protease
MPWERTMLAPYLTPLELPDTQLQELYDYAMSFVTTNNGDLMETLFAINLRLFREYEYVPGSTTLKTTPYEVMVNRKGVCQDFATLFTCLAQLLGIPARYVCGYIYTGNAGETRAGSDATHAWVQLYIPNIGWKGFDPTNGVLPQTDHVRVAYGRHYRDVTPTSGTIFGTARETMTIDVEVSDPAASTT